MMILSAVMDRLVPPVDDLPGAGTMGLAAAVEAMAVRFPLFHRALLCLLEEIAADTFPALGLGQGSRFCRHRAVCLNAISNRRARCGCGRRCAAPRPGRSASD